MNESDIQRQIIHYLNLRGYVYPVNVKGIRGRKARNKGMPDIYFMHKDKGGIWFEVKSDGGSLNFDQKLFKTLCIDCGIKHYVVRSLEEVMAVVK